MIALLIAQIPAPPADAADRGVGFGSWAPVSAYGWHGSMLVGGVHTYCITPGAPVPTGASVDHGVNGSAAGLSPQQLAGINHLVTMYGQTGDPVQAAAVGWAVKAIANREETLHAFGYRGDSLAGAIHWTMSALAPEHDRAIQERATAYYDEASRVTGIAPNATGSVVFATDPADHRLGTVRVDTTSPATGTITLTNAVFADSGSPTLDTATSGTTYAIRSTPPAEGRPYTVSGSGRWDAGLAAGVRHYTTPGGQETAGPAGRVQFEVSGADAAPRVLPFSPSISTRVIAQDERGGAFVDEVTLNADAGSWPRGDDGTFLPVTARAVVYRTAEPPVLGSTVPADAEIAGELHLTTDPAMGPEGPYTVASDWRMTAPGYYTAVWTIVTADQTTAVAAHTGADYAWTERFGEPSQIAVVTPPPAPAPAATPPPPAARRQPALPAALATTGTEPASLRSASAIAIGLLSLGIAILAARRRRLGAPAGIG